MSTITMTNIDHKAEIRQKTSKPLLWIGIMSIVMFFGGWTSAVIVSKGGDTSWFTIPLPMSFTISTILIVVSSLVFHFGFISIKKGNQSVLKLTALATLVLGIGFIISQYLGWSSLYNDGIVATGASSTNASSYLYLITFFHVLHLVAGIISLMVVSWKSVKGKYNSDNYLGVELSIIYWHFLGALWVYLYFFLQYLA